jgi:hypothetical protein
MLILEGLLERYAVQREIWVPMQHLLYDRGKPRKTLIELPGRRIGTIEIYPAVWCPIMRTSEDIFSFDFASVGNF